MKKSDIEKQLKKDLSASAPSDFNSVWDKCVTPSADGKEKDVELAPAWEQGGREMSIRSRKAISVTAVAVALLLCLVVILCLTLPRNSGDDLFLPSQSGYFVIDINPSVQVNYNTNGIVTSAKGLNGDGEELLSSLELEGITYDKAVEEIFDACELRGYFSSERDDNAILITASKDTGEKDEKMTAEINKKFMQKFEDKNMKGVVISDVENSKWQNEADKYGINGQKYELIMRYINMGGTLDESEWRTITIRELYSLISNFKDDSKDKNKN